MLTLLLTIAGAATATATLVLKQLIHVAPILEFLTCAIEALLVYALSLILMRCEELTELISQIKSVIKKRIAK